jgi:gamma-glutamyl-gamma-aminobutyrate hydrolase PuuD
MGKGDSRRQKHKSSGPQPQPIATVDNEGAPVICLPGTPEYQTAFEKIYGAQPEGLPQPVLDMLGRKISPPNILENRDVRIPMAMKSKDTQPEPKPEGGQQEAKVERRVSVLRDTHLSYPELWLGVYLVGPPIDCYGFPELFARADCYGVKKMDSADIVVFTGGADINPAIYGEKPHNSVAWDEKRDAEEIAIYEECLKKGIPMVGICRGAQLLHALNKGKLYQHVDGHHGDHFLWDMVKKIHLPKVSSVHHQMVIENEKMEVIATTSGKSTDRWLSPTSSETGGMAREVEAFYYPETCCLGVQGHPEYKGYAAFSQWFLRLLEDVITLNVDLEYKGGDKGPRRLRPEIIAQREPFVNPLAAPKKKGKK